jgi:hypothetical protein
MSHGQLTPSEAFDASFLVAAVAAAQEIKADFGVSEDSIFRDVTHGEDDGQRRYAFSADCELEDGRNKIATKYRLASVWTMPTDGARLRNQEPAVAVVRTIYTIQSDDPVVLKQHGMTLFRDGRAVSMVDLRGSDPILQECINSEEAASFSDEIDYSAAADEIQEHWEAREINEAFFFLGFRSFMRIDDNEIS